jgi:SNF2 family DNA or RNA helicase
MRSAISAGRTSRWGGRWQANHAFFVNRWWNPSNSDQACDRIVRIGQDRPVVIHSYVCRDTIEERLEQILESKRELVERVVDSLSKDAPATVGPSELAELFKSPEPGGRIETMRTDLQSIDG